MKIYVIIQEFKDGYKQALRFLNDEGMSYQVFRSKGAAQEMFSRLEACSGWSFALHEFEV